MPLSTTSYQSGIGPPRPKECQAGRCASKLPPKVFTMVVRAWLLPPSRLSFSARRSLYRASCFNRRYPLPRDASSLRPGEELSSGAAVYLSCRFFDVFARIRVAAGRRSNKEKYSDERNREAEQLSMRRRPRAISSKHSAIRRAGYKR